MAANNIFCLAFILSFGFSSSSLATNREASQEEILDNATISVAKATKSLGDKVIFCENLRQKTPLPVLDKNYMSSISATREDILIGLFHLNFRNGEKCEGRLRRELAYAIGSLVSAKNSYNLDSKPIADANIGLMYPSVNQTKMKIKYSKIPKKLRAYLEKTIGDNPFKVIEAVKSNGLSAETKLP